MGISIFLSCDDNLSYYDVDRKDYIYIHSILEPDSSTNVLVQKSNLSTLALEPIENAIVNITSEITQTKYALDGMGNGYYSNANLIVESGGEYLLNVDLGNEFHEGRTLIPPRVTVINFTYELSPNEQFYLINFDIIPVPGKSSSLYFESISEYISDTFTSTTSNQILLADIMNENILDDLNSQPNAGTYEKLFVNIPAGDSFDTIHFEFFLEENPNATNIGGELITLDQILTIHSISDELFQFLSSSIQSQSIPFTSESEPLPIKSNIFPGQGVFGASARTTLLIEP